MIRTLPPELDWSPLTKSAGVLICRIVKAVQDAQEEETARATYLMLKINGKVGDGTSLFYFHESHRDELQAAVGKVCKF